MGASIFETRISCANDGLNKRKRASGHENQARAALKQKEKLRARPEAKRYDTAPRHKQEPFTAGRHTSSVLDAAVCVRPVAGCASATLDHRPEHTVIALRNRTDSNTPGKTATAAHLCEVALASRHFVLVLCQHGCSVLNHGRRQQVAKRAELQIAPSDALLDDTPWR